MDAFIEQENIRTKILFADNKADLVALVATLAALVQTTTPANQGRATMVAGTVDVVLASITANSNVQVTSNADLVVGTLRVVLAAGVGFTIKSSAGTDAGAVAWQVTNPGV